MKGVFVPKIDYDKTHSSLPPPQVFPTLDRMSKFIALRLDGNCYFSTKCRLHGLWNWWLRCILIVCSLSISVLCLLYKAYHLYDNKAENICNVCCGAFAR